MITDNTQLLQAESIQMLAQRVHAWAIGKKFYDACPGCDGKRTVPLPAILSGDKTISRVLTCNTCGGTGSIRDARTLEQKLLHINGEVDEIFQLTRKDDLGSILQKDEYGGGAPLVPDKHVPHMRAIEIEAADIIIRVLDLAGWLGLDLGNAVLEKINFNDSRPEKHGKLH